MSLNDARRPVKAVVWDNARTGPILRTLYGWLRQGVHLGDEACCEHLESIQHLQPMRQAEHDYLYECLGVLDSKAQALLAFDSILLVLATLAISVMAPGAAVASALVVISLILAALGALACLPVIALTWTDTRDLLKEDVLFVALLKVRNRRTILYRTSWLLGALSVICVVLGVLLNELVRA